MKTIARLYVCNSLQDNELKVAIQELFFHPIDEIYVLPNYVERTKNLLNGLTTTLGSFVDYPLFSGTISKIAYETVDLFKRGADKLLIGFLPTQLKAENWKRLKELCNTLKPLCFENKKLIYFINAQRTKETEFVETVKRLQELHVKQVALAANNIQKGINYAKMFRKEFDQTMDLAVYIKNNEFMDLQILSEMEIDQIGTIFVN